MWLFQGYYKQSLDILGVNSRLWSLIGIECSKSVSYPNCPNIQCVYVPYMLLCKWFMKWMFMNEMRIYETCNHKIFDFMTGIDGWLIAFVAWKSMYGCGGQRSVHAMAWFTGICDHCTLIAVKPFMIGWVIARLWHSSLRWVRVMDVKRLPLTLLAVVS
jgi:hypothetical protein